MVNNSNSCGEYPWNNMDLNSNDSTNSVAIPLQQRICNNDDVTCSVMLFLLYAYIFPVELQDLIKTESKTDSYSMVE